MKELTIIFFSSWKFAATFPIAIYVSNMTGYQTLLYTNLGGLIGMLISFYFSSLLIKLWDTYWPERFRIKRKKDQQIFTKKNRWLVRVKQRYGLIGIVFLSPVVLSIPLGSFFAVKYYGLKKSNMIWLLTGQVLWSLVYVFFYTRLKMIVS